MPTIDGRPNCPTCGTLWSEFGDIWRIAVRHKGACTGCKRTICSRCRDQGRAFWYCSDKEACAAWKAMGPTQPVEAPVLDQVLTEAFARTEHVDLAALVTAGDATLEGTHLVGAFKNAEHARVALYLAQIEHEEKWRTLIADSKARAPALLRFREQLASIGSAEARALLSPPNGQWCTPVPWPKKRLWVVLPFAIIEGRLARRYCRQAPMNLVSLSDPRANKWWCFECQSSVEDVVHLGKAGHFRNQRKHVIGYECAAHGLEGALPFELTM